MVENRQFSSVRCIVKVITLDNQHIKTHSNYMELTQKPRKTPALKQVATGFGFISY